MSEAATSPGADDTTRVDQTGVADAAQAAGDDDIDTSAFDRAPAPDDDHEGDAGEGGGEGDETPEAKAARETAEAAAAAPDLVEVEIDGKAFKVPAELKDGYLRQADYTRKTQEAAEERRAVVADREAFEAQKQDSLAALPEEHARLAIIQHRMEATARELDAPLDTDGLTLNTIDWNAFRQAATGNPAMTDLYRDYRARYDGIRDSLTDLNSELGTAKTDLTAKEEARLAAQRTKAEEASAKEREATATELQAEGWTQDRIVETAKFAVEQLGYKAEELKDGDARAWRMVHRLASVETENATLKAQVKQLTTANNHVKAQETTPAVTAKGSGANARDPATSRGDGLSTDEWARRRRAQKAKAQA